MSLLAAMISGDADAFRPVLQHCRFEGFGAQAYGREAVQALFHTRPAALRDVQQVQSATLAALIGRDSLQAPVALFADLHEGRITRLWRLGAGSVGGPVIPVTGVPQDLDLDQRGGRLSFDPSDHPALDPGHASRVRAFGGFLLDQAPSEVVGPLVRVRPLVLRAVSAGDRTAALFRLQGASPQGLAGFYLAAFIEGEDVQVAVDVAGRDAAVRAGWRPYLRPLPQGDDQ